MWNEWDGCRAFGNHSKINLFLGKIDKISLNELSNYLKYNHNGLEDLMHITNNGTHR